MTTSPTTQHRLAPDPELTDFDFADAYREDTDDALALMRMLLLDRDSCLYRIAMMRSLTKNAGQPFPSADLTEVRHRHVEALVLVHRLMADHHDEQLSNEQVQALHRLIGDADGLWTAHSVATGRLDVPPIESETKLTVAGTSDTAITIASRGADALGESSEEKRPWLECLARLGVAASARTPEDIEAAAVELELQASSSDDSVDARRFKELASAAKLRTVQELRRYNPMELKDVDWLPTYRMQLADRAEQRARAGWTLFGIG